VESAETGVLSGYNARSWTWSETAAGFVAPTQYWQLIDGGGNQRLVGPRGSGKTTLLKMLCGQALEHWKTQPVDEDAERARASVNFSGVFIPANKMWAGQVAALTAELSEDDRPRFGLAAFSYMALRALVEAAEHRAHAPVCETPHRRVSLSERDEAELANRVAEAFGAPRASASLRSLRLSLAESVASLGRMLRRAANPSLDEHELATISTAPLLDVDFYSAAGLFCQVFDDLVDEPEGAWAFMLDELEFLPLGARAEIAEAVQGQDPRLRFKVSLAPWTDPTRHLKGMPFNDFTPVELIPRHREDAHAFANRLFAREIAGRGRPETPIELLGRGGFEPASEDTYEPGGENARVISELAQVDASFARWLRDQVKLDPDELTQRSPAQYAQLRKAAPLARLRLEFLKLGPSEKTVGRSRKRAPDLYAGMQSIWAMSEGNPRWLKAFAHELFARHRRTGPAPLHVQIEAASRVADNYLGYFRTIDADDLTPESIADAPAITPFELIQRMGRYFQTQVEGPDFTADPVTMARANMRDGWIETIVDALVFLGGLVRQGEPEEETLRLAHMFAPHFHLPPRNGRSAPLTAILGEVPADQLSLTEEERNS
jgi:energy-coupling factor transporter ATP-binding protein EcfA2